MANYTFLARIDGQYVRRKFSQYETFRKAIEEEETKIRMGDPISAYKFILIDWNNRKKTWWRWDSPQQRYKATAVRKLGQKWGSY